MMQNHSGSSQTIDPPFLGLKPFSEPDEAMGLFRKICLSAMFCVQIQGLHGPLSKKPCSEQLHPPKCLS